MKIIESKTGIYFKLESADFTASWKAFLREIKKLQSAVYNPVELEDDNYWFIGQADYNLFAAYKDLYIDRVLKDIKNYESIGFTPIPRVCGNFNKPKLKY